MTTQVRPPDFLLVIEEVDSLKIEEVVTEFARAFSLTPTFAEQILKGVPLVFLDRLTKPEIKILMPRLAELSRKGLEFRITSRAPERMPHVQWPVRPVGPFGWIGSPDGGSVKWESTAFVCPSCGEAFAIRRIGGPRFKEGHPKPGPEVKPVGASAMPPVPEERAKHETVPMDMQTEPEGGQVSGESEQPSPGGVEVLVEASPSEPQDPSLNTPGEPVEVVESILDSDLIPIDGGSPDGMPAELRNIEVTETLPAPPFGATQPSHEEHLMQNPAQRAGAETILTDHGAVPELDNVELVPLEELPAQPMDAVESPSEDVPPEERYNVFLSKISAQDRKEKAAQLMRELRGVDIYEARKLMDKTIIPVAKDVSREEAEQILEQFKKIRVFGRSNPAPAK